ncbi:hypothetical protein ABEY53_30470, partial [Bacillus mycoides]
MLKRNIFVLFAFIIGFTTIGVSSASAYTSQKFPVRPERYGEWDGVTMTWSRKTGTSIRGSTNKT